MTYTMRPLSAVAMLCVALTNGAKADGAADSGETAGVLKGTETLEEVVVTGVKLEDQVSPLQRRVTSVLGLEVSVLDTPRSVTEINTAQIRDQSIMTVTDIAKIASSAYTTNQFGGANV